MSDHGQSNKSYAVHALVLLGFTAMLGVLAFALVIHHREVPEKVHETHATR